MNSTIIDFGFISIKWYSVLILISILIGMFLIEKEANKFNIDKDLLYNLIFGVIISGIIGARIYYVIFNLDYYLHNIIDIIKIWEGGLAIHGAIIFAFIFTYFYSKKHNINIIHIIDLMIPSLMVGQIIGRWGNFFNSEAHGMQVSLEFLEKIHIPKFIIDGMNINGVYYHPTFLYESMWNLIGLLIIIFIIRKIKIIKVGDITSFYLIWYSIIRFYIEALRTDSLIVFNFKIAQIVSIILFIIGLIMFIYNRVNKNTKQYYEIEYGDD